MNHQESGFKKRKVPVGLGSCNSYLDKSQWNGIDYRKFGSTAKAIESVFERKKRLLNPGRVVHPFLPERSVAAKRRQNIGNLNLTNHWDGQVREDVILLDDESNEKDSRTIRPLVVNLDSDDDCKESVRPSSIPKELALETSATEIDMEDSVVKILEGSKAETEEESFFTVSGGLGTANISDIHAEKEQPVSGEIEEMEDEGIHVVTPAQINVKMKIDGDQQPSHQCQQPSYPFQDISLRQSACGFLKKDIEVENLEGSKGLTEEEKCKMRVVMTGELETTKKVTDVHAEQEHSVSAEIETKEDEGMPVTNPDESNEITEKENCMGSESEGDDVVNIEERGY